MIIANALKRLFTGAVADCTFLGALNPNTKIQFWYGDQKELISWIEQRKNLANYPLIWYVLNEYTEFDGWYETNARLVIMQDTQLERLNDWRTQNSYEGVLEPVWKVVQSKLITNGHVEIMGGFADRFKLRAIPNYGVEPTEKLSNSNPNKEKSASIDLIDCLAVDFKLRIKANCIN